MEQHRASPVSKHIRHRSPQQLGTTGEQVPHGITNHMMTVKLAAVLGPPWRCMIQLQMPAAVLLAPQLCKASSCATWSMSSRAAHASRS
jgi:hypothetical protein